MQIFFPKEREEEKRVSILPETAKKLLEIGMHVEVESGIGQDLFLSDGLYEGMGIKVSKDRKTSLSSSDIICRINKPELDEVAVQKKDSLHISFLDPFNNTNLIKKFADSNIISISMELIPRITRAQKMDALSSQANLGGYAAVIEASRCLSKSFPMMMTAAGTISPSRVFIIGVGVAGLQAIATAKRLGARVEAFDTRPVVEEQVKSLGAKFIKIDVGDTGETEQGYAKELTKDQIKIQQEGMKNICSRSNVVITTAQVFGRPAPLILTTEMIEAMQPGSVVVDMAVNTGGNVEGSIPNEVISKNGVSIIGLSNLPGEVASDASLVYGNNLFNLINEYWDADSKKFSFDLDDEILSKCVVTHKGKIVNKLVMERI
ncbi:MAG: NAD(P)(+) transhydrogenase (Re/Si-specific) subunit alpha [Gammaproteobacteria bacterium]|mgnify:CR=1 FL=1|nr:NAD(P)(+) transhydrogenase (Re/Si-specific) subunit alpha [Gammaproteobacteria bacterium]